MFGDKNSVSWIQNIENAIISKKTYTGQEQFYLLLQKTKTNSTFKGWKKLDGSMILGLALFHLLDNVKGIDQKADDLTKF